MGDLYATSLSRNGAASDNGRMDHGNLGQRHGLTQLARKLRRCLGANAAAPERIGQLVEDNRSQGTGDWLAELPHVTGARDAPSPIVGDNGNERQILPCRRFEIGDIECERAIAR